MMIKAARIKMRMKEIASIILVQEKSNVNEKNQKDEDEGHGTIPWCFFVESSWIPLAR
jgi:hypothetical protein